MEALTARHRHAIILLCLSFAVLASGCVTQRTLKTGDRKDTFTALRKITCDHSAGEVQITYVVRRETTLPPFFGISKRDVERVLVLDRDALRQADSATLHALVDKSMDYRKRTFLNSSLLEPRPELRDLLPGDGKVEIEVASVDQYDDEDVLNALKQGKAVARPAHHGAWVPIDPCVYRITPPTEVGPARWQKAARIALAPVAVVTDVCLVPVYGTFAGGCVFVVLTGISDPWGY